MIQVEVSHLVGRQDDVYVILEERGGGRHLPLLVAPAEALAIDWGKRAKRLGRPMTHDFVVDLLAALGDVTVDRVVITEAASVPDGEDDVYFAETHLRHGESTVAVDCRPSDAIALALRLDVPILLDETRLGDRLIAA